MRKKTHKEYELQLAEKELDFLPLEPYNGSFGYIDHICINDHVWKTTPSMILNGSGCPYCSGKKTTNQDYQKKLPQHIVVLETYINAVTPILHRCDKGHEWKGRPDNIVNGKTGCPECASHGIDLSKPCILYYIMLEKDNLIYYKIGITSKTVEQRFKAERDKKLTILKTLNFDSGSNARIAEKAILAKYPRVSVPEFLKSGYTELFEEDIGVENVR